MRAVRSLTLAARDKPGFVIDFATQRAACMSPLGDRYSGVYATSEAARDGGDRGWPRVGRAR